MTCVENREQHSAFLDGELPPAERALVETHLAGCAECSVELARLARMLGMLHALPPERAPLGFVDRVLEAARPTPWYVRAGRRLTQPWRVKLPLEAAAVVLVALGAVYVFQRTPELQQAARYEAPAPAPAPAPPTPPARADVPAPAAPPAPAASSAPALPAPVAQAPPVSAPDARQRAKSVAPPQQPAPAAPAAPAPAVAPPALSKDANRAAESSKLESAAKERAEPSGKEQDAGPRDATSAMQDAARPAAPPATLPVPPPAREGAGEKKTGGARMDAQSPPAAGAPPAEPRSQRLGRVGPAAPEAARAFVPPDASGRLSVNDREAAERALVELRGRLGVTEAFRRDAGDGAVVIELIVPRAALADFARGLDGIGRWTWDRDPSTLPPQVRLQILLAR